MNHYPTQLDEIDQWLFDSFGILPGACSSMENLRHTTARMVAESLWPKCKDSLHIQETSKENANSFTDEEREVDLESEIEEYWIATGWSKVITLGKFKVIARYFYGLGQLNSK